MWLPDDTEKALAFEAAEREACGRCGTRKADWFDPDTGYPHDPPLLEAVARHCEGCAQRDRLALDIAADSERNSDSHETRARAAAGLSVALSAFDPNR